MTDEFESPLDKAIREAREAGAFDNLPGKGKPLSWQDELNVPDDQRLAYKVMRDNDVVPDWLQMGRALDAEYEAARAVIERARAERAAGKLSPAGWKAAARAFAGKVALLNKRIIGYNVRAPHEHFHKRPYPIDPDIKDSID